MVKDGFINASQGIEILEKFFEVNFDFDELAQFYISRRTKVGLTKFVKQKFKSMLIQLESRLFQADYIDKLKLYDNSSIQLFDELIKMDKYFPKKHHFDFLFQEKSKYSQMEQSSSQKRMEIYLIFLSYAENHNLFRFSLLQNRDMLGQELIEIPQKIYNSSDLELIYMLYQMHQGDYSKIAESLKVQGYSQEKFEGRRLQKNLKNLELIGIYYCYRKSVSSRGGKGNRWAQFVQDEQEYRDIISNWDSNLMVILVRIAIRDDATPQQIKSICWRLGRRYNHKPLVEIHCRKPKIGQKKYARSAYMNKMRAELLSVLSSKISFNPISQNS